MATGESISVVVPSRAEGATLLRCLDDVASLRGVGEVVVAAWGETEETRSRVGRERCARWIECRTACRGHQLNRGAEAARGDVLLFLHADSCAPADAPQRIHDALRDPRVMGGAFRLSFDADHPALRLLEGLSALRLTASFLGDQGIFCRRDAFVRLGGFRDLSAFEDVEFIGRLARLGRLARIDSSVRTSARRFADRGPWRQFARNAWLLGLFHAGVSPQRLAALYAR